MNWDEIVQQHTIPPRAAEPLREQQNELDGEAEAMFAAGRAEDARSQERQAEAWEKTDPDYNPDREAEMEAGA